MLFEFLRHRKNAKAAAVGEPVVVPGDDLG
jgi:hypothetical protein